MNVDNLMFKVRGSRNRLEYKRMCKIIAVDNFVDNLVGLVGILLIFE